MANPVRRILDQCRIGFTAKQKVGLCALGAVYILSPLDLVPDLLPGLGQLDDIGVPVLAFKILLSPTIVVSRRSAASRPREIAADAPARAKEAVR